MTQYSTVGLDDGRCTCYNAWCGTISPPPCVVHPFGLITPEMLKKAHLYMSSPEPENAGSGVDSPHLGDENAG